MVGLRGKSSEDRFQSTGQPSWAGPGFQRGYLFSAHLCALLGQGEVSRNTPGIFCHRRASIKATAVLPTHLTGSFYHWPMTLSLYSPMPWQTP
jgi:hypothetical protein